MLRASRVSFGLLKSKRSPDSPKTWATSPQYRPYIVSVEAGKKYYWCSCGLSKNQPYCDGAHKQYNKDHETAFKPISFTSEEPKKVMLCGCKQTDNAPYCDFSHIRAGVKWMVGAEK